MRKQGLMALLAAGAIALVAATAGAKIQGTHHDFGLPSSTEEICRPCHTPHNADASVRDAPLWNHQVTTASFTTYASPTTDAAIGQPSGVTKLCLSCHDGTVAVDSFEGVTGTWKITFPRALIGTDLTRHHPVSFAYDANLASRDGELWDPTTAPSGLGGTIAKDLLRNGRLECVSCHDVHVSRGTGSCMDCHFVHGGPIYGETVSLWKSNAQSALCLTCHKK